MLGRIYEWRAAVLSERVNINNCGSTKKSHYLFSLDSLKLRLLKLNVYNSSDGCAPNEWPKVLASEIFTCPDVLLHTCAIDHRSH